MNPRPRRSAARIPLTTQNRQSVHAAGPTRRHKPDYWLLTLSALLLTLGLVVVYSISPGLAAAAHVSQSYYVSKQLIDVGLGVVGFALATKVPISFWRKSAKPLAIAALVGSLVVMFTPINASYPIAELIKLALLIWVARFLDISWRQGKLSDYRATLRPLLGIILLIGIVVAKLQSDLGSAAVMLVIIGAMAFTVGIPLKKVAMAGGIVALLVILAVSTSSYRRARLTTFLHPDANCQSTGYQACQALIAVGSGGTMGLGLGYSVQAYGYLPEASNDSIFAIIAEKFGFIGTTLVVVLYGLFITRLKQIIEKTSDQFSRLIVVAVLAWFSTQAMINIGAMLGLLPLKGITLPLISQGGTSLVCLTAALGIVFQISRYTNYSATEPKITANETNSNNYSPDGRRIGRAYNSALTTRPRT